MTPIAGIKFSFATKLSFVSRTCARKPLKACAFFDERSPADAPRPERAATCDARAPARRRRLALRAAVARSPAEAGQQNARDRLTRQSLDGAHGRLVDRGDERDGAPGVSGPSRATDAVHVVFWRDGHVVVDDVRDRLNVNAARRDVGGDEDARAPLAEAAQRRLPLRLRAVGVYAVGLVLARFEYVRESLGPAARAREDEHALEVLALALAFKKVEQ